MKRFLMRLTVVTISLLTLSLPAFAGQLDDYYLKAFGEQPGSALEKAVLLQAAGTTGVSRSGTALKHGLKRDWNQLESATQQVLAKQLAAPVLTGEATLLSSGGHFLIHYATTGSDAPPLTDANGNGIPDWVETVAATFEQVLSTYVSLGYRPAPTIGGAPYDVYLHNLVNIVINGQTVTLYGQTTSTQLVPSAGFANASASFIEIDKDFQNPIYVNARGGPFTPQQSLQITAAHEYHHAIQYGYNVHFDVWYAEATATWFEDEQFDLVNQIYNYPAAWFANSRIALDSFDSSTATALGTGYGRWIFNRFLAEQHGGIAIVRNAWEKLATLNSPNGADIPMVPVLEALLSSSFNSSLGADFFGLTKRIYDRKWSSHPTEIGLMPFYVPTATYSSSSFPVNSGNLANPPSVTLPHYSFAFYRFVPLAGAPASLTITVNGTSGIAAAVFKKASGVISEVAPNPGGASFTSDNFNTLDEVVLLLANTTNVDGHRADFSTDGSASTVTEPPNVATSTIPSQTAASSGGGSSGCFIATAAYGSYLHPQVRVLREFRDHYLLTNAPGRAFVALYYRLSPPAADFIARHDTLRLLVRLLLTPLVFAVKYPLALVGMLIIAVSGIALTVRRRKPALLHAG